jgi:hypothetical protein
MSNETGSQGELETQNPPIADAPGDCVIVMVAEQLNEVWKLSLSRKT